MPFAWQVVYGHLDDPENEDIRRGISYLRLRPGEALPMTCLSIPVPVSGAQYSRMLLK